LRNWTPRGENWSAHYASLLISSCGMKIRMVVDYKVMCDALLAADTDVATFRFADRTLDDLLRAPVVLASIEMSDALAGLGVGETRAHVLAENTAPILPLKQADVRSPSALHADLL